MMSFKKIIAAMMVFTLAIAAVTPTAVQPTTVCAASKIKLNKKSATIKVGKTVQLKVKGTKKKVKWSSSNTYVAKVTQKGKVTGKHVGSAKITAKISSKKLTCKIKVKGKAKTVATKTPKPSIVPTRVPIITGAPVVPTNTATVTGKPVLPTRIPSVTEGPALPTKAPAVTEIPVMPTKAPDRTETPVMPTKAPAVTETPVMPTEAPAVTETPVTPTEAPAVTETPVTPTEAPAVTETPVTPTEAPTVTETPGQQVDLALNFYLEEYDPNSPSAQFVTVHMVNHLTEDVYVETEAYLTTKGKDYPAMIYDSKEGDLKKIKPTDKEDIYGELVMYDSKEYVMGNYTDETFWLTSDENSTLTFYFRIGEQRYKAVINYNEMGAVFREATEQETFQPVVTETPTTLE